MIYCLGYWKINKHGDHFMKFSTLLSAASLISLCISTITVAQDKHFTISQIKTASELRDNAMEGTMAWDILESITTEVGPRFPGSEGDKLAVKWAMKKFEQLGYDKIWKEPVPVPVWERGIGTGEIVSPFPQPVHLAALGFSISTPKGGIEAEVIHFKTIQDLSNAPEGSLEGKIAFISHRMKRAKDLSEYRKAGGARRIGAVEASKKDAIGIIIRSLGTDDHRNPHTGGQRYQDGIKKIPAAALSNPDADVLVRQFERGLPVTFKMNLQNKDLGQSVTYNVIGEIKGSSRPDEVVVIGGHLDSWDLGTGAIDDGAGIAISMEAGRIIGNMKNRPARTIRVIAFAAEEIGLYGGREYARAHKGELNNHIIGAESDLGSGRVWEFSPGVNESSLPVMHEIHNVLKPLGIKWGDNKGTGGPDIGPMHRAGVPALNLQQDATNYFDLHHTPDDTLDKVDAKDLNQNVAAYVTFSYLAADYDGRFDGK